MGRPRAFNETAVLDAAAAEFRVHGFAETSTEQLCDAAGMLRGSLYNAFTSKEELFIRALQHYATKFRELQAEILTDTTLTGAERLRTVMNVILQEERDAHEHGHGAGCMVVQSMMAPDLRDRDPRVTQILEQDLRARLGLLEEAIRAGHADGSVPGCVTPDEGALLFVTVTNGIRTMGQAGTDPDQLTQTAFAGTATLFT
ncbi:TetR/AcrR family transcriptional regulator [Corynebacterium sp.]|uniref:TetR/AcrR family transcriptional regulator n=1 Tax=Corynebacterium sp. TaxID=1720 RepID=UPI0028AD8920|nr:TetR/AcrR family transcriptional regulator [Corynebacterium sp.]